MTDNDIKRIWDGFGKEGQDIPLTEFTKQYKELIAPAGVHRDAVAFQQHREICRARAFGQRHKIDKALKKQ